MGQKDNRGIKLVFTAIVIIVLLVVGNGGDGSGGGTTSDSNASFTASYESMSIADIDGVDVDMYVYKCSIKALSSESILVTGEMIWLFHEVSSIPTLNNTYVLNATTIPLNSPRVLSEGQSASLTNTYEVTGDKPVQISYIYSGQSGETHWLAIEL